MTDMYQNLGIHWASSVPAFLALMCVPFPFLFYKYGARIRMKCKYAAQAAQALEDMKGSEESEEGEEVLNEDAGDKNETANEVGPRKSTEGKKGWE
jgi:hypothetical protein